MFAEINWEEQWAIHAPLFKNGKAFVKLPDQQMIKLLPGPGFGDYSHPTTKLMVNLMTSFVSNEVIFDIGCGSGILSVAAAKMGAKKLFACDIEPEAMEHTKRNAALNQFHVTFDKPAFCKPVILMNMIASEQKIAWRHYRSPFTTLITSGILQKDKNEYLTFAYHQGWQLLHEASLDGWLSYIFKEKEQ